MKLVGILVGVICAIAVIVMVLLSRPASPMSLTAQTAHHAICPGVKTVWQSRDIGDLYGKYIATRIQANEPIQDRDILGAAWDVLNCVRNGTDQ